MPSAIPRRHHSEALRANRTASPWWYSRLFPPRNVPAAELPIDDALVNQKYQGGRMIVIWQKHAMVNVVNHGCGWVAQLAWQAGRAGSPFITGRGLSAAPG